MTILANKNRFFRGFTLIELIMVLVILAILATAALNVVEFQVDQTRFEGTKAILENIENAIIGPTDIRNSDGTLMVAGFLSDVGRPPHSLEELLARPNGIPEFAILRPDNLSGVAASTELGADQQITIGAGWRGPYLRLPPGASSIRDGWGNSLQPFASDGQAATGSAATTILRSLGRSSTVGGTDYEQDQLLILHAENTAVAAGIVTSEQVQNRIETNLVVDIFDQTLGTNPSDNMSKLVLRIYGPHTSTANPGVIEIGTIQEEIYGEPGGEPFSGEAISIVLPNLSLGARVVRVYEVSDGFTVAASTDLSPTGPNGSSIIRASSPIRLGLNRQTASLSLILP